MTCGTSLLEFKKLKVNFKFLIFFFTSTNMEDMQEDNLVQDNYLFEIKKHFYLKPF
jgi:hypothetical protein